MAREEQPREDLLAEAKNLVERVSLQLCAASDAENDVLAGFRRDGSLALFFGQQRVYQFTSTGELRRAFVDGLLYKAQAGALIAMRRERTPDAVDLLSTPLNAQATNEFLAQITCCLFELRRSLECRDYAVVGQVPADGHVVERVLTWLVAHGGSATIANSPRSA